jgi:hypothetical protein
MKTFKFPTGILQDVFCQADSEIAKEKKRVMVDVVKDIKAKITEHNENIKLLQEEIRLLETKLQLIALDETSMHKACMEHIHNSLSSKEHVKEEE